MHHSKRPCRPHRHCGCGPPPTAGAASRGSELLLEAFCLPRGDPWCSRLCLTVACASPERPLAALGAAPSSSISLQATNPFRCTQSVQPNGKEEGETPKARSSSKLKTSTSFEWHDSTFRGYSMSEDLAVRKSEFLGDRSNPCSYNGTRYLPSQP